MRLALGLMISTILVGGAEAADYLRGMIAPPSYSLAAPQHQSNASFDWSGAYLGGSFAYVQGDVRAADNRAGLTNNLTVSPTLDLIIHDALNFPTRATTRGRSYGGFVGYNTQWDDVVVGVEGELAFTNLDRQDAIGPINRTDFIGSERYTTTINGRRRTTMPNYAVGRVRFGWAVGQFLPYVTLGLVAGNVRSQDHVNGSYDTHTFNAVTGNYDYVSTTPLNRTQKKSGIAGGYAMGVGLDWALSQNIFLRANYEYLTIGGSNSTRITFQTARVGAGVKF